MKKLLPSKWKKAHLFHPLEPSSKTKKMWRPSSFSSQSSGPDVDLFEMNWDLCFICQVEQVSVKRLLANIIIILFRYNFKSTRGKSSFTIKISLDVRNEKGWSDSRKRWKFLRLFRNMLSVDVQKSSGSATSMLILISTWTFALFLPLRVLENISLES